MKCKSIKAYFNKDPSKKRQQSNAIKILSETFGHTDFKSSLQKDAVCCVNEGQIISVLVTISSYTDVCVRSCDTMVHISPLPCSGPLLYVHTCSLKILKRFYIVTVCYSCQGCLHLYANWIWEIVVLPVTCFVVVRIDNCVLATFSIDR